MTDLHFEQRREWNIGPFKGRLAEEQGDGEALFVFRSASDIPVYVQISKHAVDLGTSYDDELRAQESLNENRAGNRLLQITSPALLSSGIQLDPTTQDIEGALLEILTNLTIPHASSLPFQFDYDRFQKAIISSDLTASIEACCAGAGSIGKVAPNAELVREVFLRIGILEDQHSEGSDIGELVPCKVTYEQFASILNQSISATLKESLQQGGTVYRSELCSDAETIARMAPTSGFSAKVIELLKSKEVQ